MQALCSLNLWSSFVLDLCLLQFLRGIGDGIFLLSFLALSRDLTIDTSIL